RRDARPRGHPRLDRRDDEDAAQRPHAGVPRAVAGPRRGAGLGRVLRRQPDGRPRRRQGLRRALVEPHQVRGRRALVLRRGHVQPERVHDDDRGLAEGAGIAATWAEFEADAPELAAVAGRLWSGIVALDRGAAPPAGTPWFAIAYLAS